jgi:chemotaxis protein CheD
MPGRRPQEQKFFCRPAARFFFFKKRSAYFLMTPEPAPVEHRIHIVQGQQHVDSDPHVVLTTILGSCVAACLWDAQGGIGGMNHFLLPGDRRPSGGQAVIQRQGVHLMELLVNALLRHGAQRHRLQAKLFGGARMIRGLTDIGDMNAAFAERFLRDEGIAIVGGSLRGDFGRRIQFWPTTGRARQTLIGQKSAIFEEERRIARRQHAGAGTVEFF